MSELLNISNLCVGYVAYSPLATWEKYTLNSGQLVALTGLNGSGKTTLFKTILGDVSPLGGEILIAGKNAGKINLKEKSKLISVVLTRQPIYAELTVEEFIWLGRHPYLNWMGQAGNLDKKTVFDTLSLLKLENLKTARLHEISDGQLQKVQLARALAQDTPLILMDEPTSFLDWVNKNELMLLLRDIVNETKKSILFSSHDIPLLTKMAHQILAIEDNTIKPYSPENFEQASVLNNVFKTSFFK
ncbi:MAG: ABC transporter ATP-binding protein [Flavobacteriales bacterium]